MGRIEHAGSAWAEAHPTYLLIFAMVTCGVGRAERKIPKVFHKVEPGVRGSSKVRCSRNWSVVVNLGLVMNVSELQGNWRPVGDLRIANEQSVAIFLRGRCGKRTFSKQNRRKDRRSAACRRQATVESKKRTAVTANKATGRLSSTKDSGYAAADLCMGGRCEIEPGCGGGRRRNQAVGHGRRSRKTGG
jgi:hypothetical protein